MKDTFKRVILYLVLFSFGIFLTLSIYSFDPQDPGFGVTGAKEIRNYGGILGAYFSSFIYLVFGFSSLLIPPLLFLSFILYIQKISLKKVLFLFIAILFAFSLTFSLLFDLLQVKNQNLWGKFPLQGGILGEFSIVLLSYIGIPGIFLLILLLLSLSVFMVFEGFPFFREKMKKLLLFSNRKGGNREGEVSLSPKNETVPTVKDETSPISLQTNLPESKLLPEPPKSSRKPSLQLPPPLELLNDPPPSSYKIKPEELKERALLLKAKLREFGIEGEVTGINPGPVITVFEFKPAPGIKLSKILSLVDDLALGLSAKSVRIVAPIPGKSVIGIEISNPQREWVYLKEIISQEVFRASESPLTFALGKDLSGKPVVADLRKMPHLLIAGSTGSGKSIFIHSIILSIIYKSTPREVRFLMIDPKRIELSVYDGIPYLLHPVVLEPKMATRALRWAVSEMERRYSLFEEFSVRNLESYNEEFEEKLPYIVIIIDELADLMVVSSKEVETLLTRLAQMARAAGIHLIVATQRPSVDVITGLIKVNFPARISFQVTSKVDSRTILDTQGAERLLGAGDMLFMPPGSSYLQRIHAPFVSEKEVKRVVEYLKALGEPQYLADFDLIAEEETKEDLPERDYEDELYQEALKIAYQYGKISVSMLQRKLRIGYNRAARLVEKMEEEGILGPSDGVRPRPVIGPRKPI
ncbi:MAG: cell division protein FtsK [Caldimicrobium thiodismutans]|uniref:Cell division protein FtsK n=1 Tax=Caldimicrobium thiodismutans TaxID=1653476 RepID=A0A2N7PJ07_9BACT|nr:MAG: cell division protein FtsK [Caldimicrobium thiodismutans]